MNTRKITSESGGRCYYCGVVLRGANFAIMEHVIPKARGGADSSKNIVAACKKCNTEKGVLMVNQWRSKILQQLQIADFKFYFESAGLLLKGQFKNEDIIRERPDLMERFGLVGGIPSIYNTVI